MIKLISAQVNNFRQLRDVRLSFARSRDKHLTIVRAENGTGKTTLMTALTWALFGDEVLGETRQARTRSGISTYRVHPLDWNVDDDGRTCSISVTIEFATIDGETGIENTYKLVRNTTVDTSQESTYNIKPSILSIYEQRHAGDTPLPNPNDFISNQILPKSLKDVFFIDGDRALAFIEAADSQTAKRERVEQAVRQLLGIEILEKAETHIKKTKQRAVQAVKRESIRTVNNDLEGISVEELAEIEEDTNQRIHKLDEQYQQINRDTKATENRKEKADLDLREALAAGSGDRPELESDLSQQESDLKNEREHYQGLVKRQRELINDSTLLSRVAATSISQAGQLLERLESDGVIPDTLPEVVRDRLRRTKCICGRDVSEGTEGHGKLSELLRQVEVLDDSQGILLYLSITTTNLIHRHTHGDDEPDPWIVQLKGSTQDIIRCRQDEDKLDKSIKELRTKISKIPQKDIQELHNLVTTEEKELKRLNNDAGRVQEQIRTTKQILSQTTKKRRDAQKREKKHHGYLADEIAACDLLDVVQRAIKKLQDETVDEVSGKMSEIFLNMIVADPETDTLINRAELTHQHDIVVFAADGQRLNPDIDLSGAQRRALTLAFIFALAQVSGVKAPNVVDTPLGMTSHLVRRALLEYAIKNSTQLVMFLTGSETQGVEDILDRYAGRTYTMTFSDHYPEQLVNDPGTGRRETLLCKCDHRTECRLCQRKEPV